MSPTTQVVCRHCDSIVRVPTARLAEAPACPRCHAALFDGHPVELTEANFNRHLGKNELPMVVDFWAPWCGPCRAMAPAYAQATARLEPQLRFAKLNTDEARQVSGRYAVRSIPTLIVFRDGREAARQAGAMDSGSLMRWLTQSF